MSVEVSARPNALTNAIDRARRHLPDLQNPTGWWNGELESNVTIEAEDLFLRRYLGILDRGTAERKARWIRSRRQPDGTWTNYHGGPPVGDTALAIIALTDAGILDNDACVIEAADWLLEQEVRTPDDWAVRQPGLGLGGWAFEFANDNYPDVDDTAEVGLALRRVRHPDPGRLDAALRRAVAWLEAHQNADGGWGEDLRSYEDPAWIGRGASTASQTAWALIDLLEADQDSPAVARGVDYLLRTQRQDGTWDEELYTGTGFPGAFYISYHLYRLVYPLMALGRYAKKVGRDEDGM